MGSQRVGHYLSTKPPPLSFLTGHELFKNLMKATDPLCQEIYIYPYTIAFTLVVLGAPEAQPGALDCTFPWCFCPHTYTRPMSGIIISQAALAQVRASCLAKTLLCANMEAGPEKSSAQRHSQWNWQGRPRARVDYSFWTM